MIEDQPHKEFQRSVAGFRLRTQQRSLPTVEQKTRERFGICIGGQVFLLDCLLEDRRKGVIVLQRIIKLIIPHQANRRIIDAVGDRLGAKPEQLFVNVDKFGNTSAASVGIALDEAVSTGRVQRGDLILLVVFGAGLTWGAAVIEW